MKKEITIYYKELNVSDQEKSIIGNLKKELTEQLYIAVKSFGHGNYAEIKN